VAFTHEQRYVVISAGWNIGDYATEPEAISAAEALLESDQGFPDARVYPVLRIKETA